MVDIEELTKRYGKFVALDHMNLHIDKGEIFGFVGPNGAGKTTTMRIRKGHHRRCRRTWQTCGCETEDRICS